MIEKVLKITINIFLGLIMLVIPVQIMYQMSDILISVKNYIYILGLEIIIVFSIYFWIGIRFRKKYLRILNKLKSLNSFNKEKNQNMDIKQDKISHFSDMLFGFELEYKTMENVDLMLERIKKDEKKLRSNKRDRQTQSKVREYQLKSTIQELEKMNDALAIKEYILDNFINIIESIYDSNISYKIFFEDLLYYFETYFELKNIIVVKYDGNDYKILKNTSNKKEVDFKLIQDMMNSEKSLYYNSEINKKVGYETIIKLQTGEKKHGLLLLDSLAQDHINTNMFEKLLQTMGLELSKIADNLLYLDNLDSENKRLKQDVSTLKSKMRVMEENSEEQLEEMTNLYEEIVLLHHAGNTLGKILDKQKLEKISLEMILEIIEAEFGFIFYYSKKEKAIDISKISFFKEKKFTEQILIKKQIRDIKIFDMLKEKTNGMIINDISNTQILEDISKDLKTKLNRLLATPIYQDSELIGGIVIFNKETDFTAGNKSMTVSLTNQFWLAMRNLIYLDEEIERKQEKAQLKIANEIQSALFPKNMPKLPNIEVAGSNIPAKEVGGDYYDLIQVDENNLLGLIADVSGKGIPAALLVSMVKTVFKMLVKEMDKIDPSEILYKLNNIFCEEDIDSRFITAIAFHVNIKTNKINFSNAGHGPIIIYDDKKKKIVNYDLDGTVLGFMANEKFESKKIKLNKNDIALLYTDGLTEARNTQGKFFGEQRVEKIVTEIKKYPAPYILGKINREVGKFTKDAKQNDDITILVLKGE
ncbi:MAG: GAF domain-containing SpoIIE family protein phosphatase [Fusobacteriota bacterium]